MPQLRKHLRLPRHTFPTSSTFGCVGEQNLRVRTVSPEKEQTTNVTFVLWTHVSHWQHFDIRHYESMTSPPPNHTRDVAGLVYLEISTATAMHLLLAWSKASNFIFFLQGMETTKVCVISVQNKHKFGRRKQKKPNNPKPNFIFFQVDLFSRTEAIFKSYFLSVKYTLSYCRGKKPSFIPTNKVASSLFAQATKPFLCSSNCTRYRLHKELLYLDYIK